MRKRCQESVYFESISSFPEGTNLNADIIPAGPPKTRSPLIRKLTTAINNMSVPDGFTGLRFPCECVSSREEAYSDPWSEITKNRLLQNGTKEQILNVLAAGPNTITQIAEALSLSAPSVHTHVTDMVRSELLREAVDWEKTHPAERYYELNFPVFKADECEEFRALCEEMSKDLVGLFEKKRRKIERAFRQTGLSAQGWELTDVTPCLFANMYRGARTRLEEQGLMATREKHKNGARWIFWAEEPETNGRRK